MVEAVQPTEKTFQTERRVIRSIKKFTNSQQQRCFLASASRYSHNQMDGKVMIFTAEQLLEASNGELPQMQFFESQTACGDSTVVKVKGKMYLISGFDDGVLCLMDLQRQKGESVKRPVFQTHSDGNATALDSGVYDSWNEQAWEHSDSIISVEASQTETTSTSMRLLSASKDGQIFVWSISGDEDSTEDMMQYVADVTLDEPLTKAKWLTETCILASTTHGSVFLIKL